MVGSLVNRALSPDDGVRAEVHGTHPGDQAPLVHREASAERAARQGAQILNLVSLIPENTVDVVTDESLSREETAIRDGARVGVPAE